MVPVPARLLVLALAQVLAHRVQLPLLARLPVLAKAHPPVPALRSVVVGLVVEAAVAVELLLSRQSFSAAMARNTP